tara:strand:+ start:349 stop:687 length:339 start_codon:yes stop_codon:yes gene_type:complete
MASRYTNRAVATNKDENYKHLLEDRNIRFVKQYRTGTLRHPTASEIADLDTVAHVWKVGDRYYKLAHEYYRDSTLWWVIAWFNQAPTESHLKLGDPIQIPLPLDRVLGLFDV